MSHDQPNPNPYFHSTQSNQMGQQPNVPPSTPPPAQSGSQHLQQVLTGVQQNLSGGTPERNLCDLLLNQLNIRNTTPGLSAQIDPVLSLMIDLFEQRSPRDEIWQSAYFALKQNLDNYQSVFGSCLPDQLISRVQASRSAEAFDAGTNATLHGDFSEYVRRLQLPASAAATFTTGVSSLDEALDGGVHGLTFIVGPKGSGKTCFLLNCCVDALSADTSTAVLFYSLDMPKKRVMDRLVCRCLNMSQRELTAGASRQEMVNRIRHDFPDDVLSRMRIVERDFDVAETDQESGEYQRAGMTELTVWNDVCVLLNATDSTRVLIAIDLFQKMVVPGSTSVSEYDKYRLDMIDQVSQRLRRNLGDDAFAFLVSSEMRKSDGTRRSQEVTIDDLKGDGRLASDADNILLLWETRQESSDVSEVTLRIGKGRDGVTRGDHQLRFLHRLGQFHPLPSQPSAPEQHSSAPVQTQSGNPPIVDPFG